MAEITVDSLFATMVKMDILEPKDRYLFVTSNKDLFINVYQSGYKVVNLDENTTLEQISGYIQKNQYKGNTRLNELIFVGLLDSKKESDELNELLKSYGLNHNADGFKIFYNKEYLKNPESAEDLAQELEKYINSHTNPGEKITLQEPKPDAVANYIDNLIDGEIEKFKQGASRSTGFKVLDSNSKGIYPGLYVIGAISSLGKTTFISQIADQMAENGEHVLYFSLEQSRLEMVSKAIARRSAKENIKTATTSLRFRSGRIDDHILDIVDLYKSEIEDRLSIIECNFDSNIEYVKSYVRDYIIQNGVKPIVIIDYLQILQGVADRKLSTKEMVDSNVTELKRLSRDSDIPIIAISSVNRNNYMAPMDFESFKESGSIEYTADVVWGLQLAEITNNEIFNTSKDSKIKEKREAIKRAKAAIPRRIDLVCLKNRYGISSYGVEYEYFPQFDYFREVNTPNDENPFEKSDKKIKL